MTENSFCDRLNPELFVVTAAHSSEHSGCLVGFATQCSIEPLRVLVGISVLNHTYDVARRAQALGVHLLGSNQHELAKLFGSETGDEVDKFARCSWHIGETGVPMLDECAAWMEGNVLSEYELGDHVGFLVAVVRSGAGQQDGELRLRDVPDIEAGHPPEEIEGSHKF